MNNLASVYDGNGYGEEAVRWYRKAADKGYETAMYNLGWMYEKGRGVKQDRQMAAQYIIDAIRKRNKNTAPYMAADVATWSKQFRLELQRLLQAAGVYDGSIDGSLGPGTRRAMQALAEKSR
ncbi:MAG: SEL1-like repeat protein [bacterium]|nr:SEL1-like repeat protein [bacterium]